MYGYVLGVDGGSTKTHCALFDTDGNKMDFLQIGSTNHENLRGSYGELKEKLSMMITEVLDRNNIGISQIQQSVFGLSGVDTRNQHARISKIIEKIGLSNFVLCNDSFLGIKAGSKSGHGICVINGSGCTVCGIDKAGKMLQIGGQGEFTGEPGGGGFLGYYAIRSVYNYLFRGGKETLMTEMLFDRFSIQSKYEFIDVIREKVDLREIKVGELARVVFQAANKSDALALSVLEYMGSEIAVSVNGMIRELGFDKNEELNVILTGSINVKGENTRGVETLKKAVMDANSGFQMQFSTLKQPPVAGAVVWALEKAIGGNALYEKVITQL